jgi:hypothetical protein
MPKNGRGASGMTLEQRRIRQLKRQFLDCRCLGSREQHQATRDVEFLHLEKEGSEFVVSILHNDEGVNFIRTARAKTINELGGEAFNKCCREIERRPDRHEQMLEACRKQIQKVDWQHQGF